PLPPLHDGAQVRRGIVDATGGQSPVRMLARGRTGGVPTRTPPIAYAEDRQDRESHALVHLNGCPRGGVGVQVGSDHACSSTSNQRVRRTLIRDVFASMI